MFLKESNFSFWFILRLVRKDILIISIITITLSILDNFLPNDQAFPLTVPALIGTALSLILAFRTGQAYDRWWEGRKIWGAIINDSRSLVRAALGYVKDHDKGEGAYFIKHLAMRQMAWCYSLGSTLRSQDAFIHAANFLTKDERKHIEKFKNVPNALLREHSLAIKGAEQNGLISDYAQWRLDEIVMRLTDSMGKCERIKKTVFPTSYTRIVHVLIYIFSITLTIGITDYRGLVEIPVSIILTTVFLMLEQVAIILQDPWENNPSDIPVTAIARTIEIDLKQMIGEENIPLPFESERNFLM